MQATDVQRATAVYWTAGRWNTCALCDRCLAAAPRGWRRSLERSPRPVGCTDCEDCVADLDRERGPLHAGQHVRSPSRDANPTSQTYVGRVLPIYHPTVWRGSIAFDGREPTRPEIREHVERIHVTFRREGMPIVMGVTEVPVLWDFPRGPVVYWERVSGLERVEMPEPTV